MSQASRSKQQRALPAVANFSPLGETPNLILHRFGKSELLLDARRER